MYYLKRRGLIWKLKFILSSSGSWFHIVEGGGESDIIYILEKGKESIAIFVQVQDCVAGYQQIHQVLGMTGILDSWLYCSISSFVTIANLLLLQTILHSPISLCSFSLRTVISFEEKTVFNIFYVLWKSIAKLYSWSFWVMSMAVLSQKTC